MSKPSSQLCLLRCLDSYVIAEARRKELDISPSIAAELGKSAMEIAVKGYYFNQAGEQVDLSDYIKTACSKKLSIPPETTLPAHESEEFRKMSVQVTNETTLGASMRLVERELRPLALNFANGVHPGGGFLSGSRAQEEVLC